MASGSKIEDTVSSGEPPPERRRKDGRAESPSGCTICVNTGDILDRGKRYVLSAGSAVVGRHDTCELCLADKKVSGHHAEFKIVPNGIQVQDLGSRNGIKHRGRRIDCVVLQPGERVILGRSVIELLPVTGSDKSSGTQCHCYGELVGTSAPMRRVFSILSSLEHSDAPVLIQGETGTGKELTARALHQHGNRAQRPLVIIDCSNIPRDLMESELFGHTKGAFTGALAARAGAFEAADKGTVFLDEVDELPIGLQPKLLRVLETGQVKRVGETRFRSIDARLIATTKRDLAEAVRTKHFRSDLYYRLAVVKINLPPLRERLEDIPMLAQHLMVQISKRPVARLSPQTEGYLMSHQWPGNVRQLRNAIERMLALGSQPGRGESDLPLHIEVTKDIPFPVNPTADLQDDQDDQDDLLEALDEPIVYDVTPFREARAQALLGFERTYVERLMARAQGNLSQAARLAGIDRKYVRILLKKHGCYKA